MRTAASLLLVLIAVSTVNGERKTEDAGSILVNGTTYIKISTRYDLDEALPGQSFTLDVIVASGDPDLTVDKFELEGSDVTLLNPPPVTIKFETKEVNAVENSPGRPETIHHCHVELTPDAEVRIFRMKISFTKRGTPGASTFFDLRVGTKTATSGGVKIKPEQSPVVLKTGSKQPFSLFVKNDSRSYNIIVKEVTISSNPPGLVQAEPLHPDHLVIETKQEPEIQIPLTVNSPDALDLIKGFTKDPTLTATVVYQDPDGRKVPDLRQTFQIKVVPNTSVLILAIVIGVLVGGLIRFYLEFLARKKKLKGIAVLKFAFYTTVFGLVIAALALAGQLEIKGFGLSGSYDQPLVLFIIGLTGAVGGMQIFVAWYNSLRQGAGKAGTE